MWELCSVESAGHCTVASDFFLPTPNQPTNPSPGIEFGTKFSGAEEVALALAAADSAGTGSESKASSRNQRQHDILSKIILNGFSKILLHSGCVGTVRKQQLELGNIKSDLVSGGGHGVGGGGSPCRPPCRPPCPSRYRPQCPPPCRRPCWPPFVRAQRR